MVNFFNCPAKTSKRLIIFLVLFFVLAGTLLPQHHSLAQTPPPTPPPTNENDCINAGFSWAVPDEGPPFCDMSPGPADAPSQEQLLKNTTPESVFKAAVSGFFNGLKDGSNNILDFLKGLPLQILASIILGVQSAIAFFLYYIGYYLALLSGWIFYTVSYYLIKNTGGAMSITRDSQPLGLAFVSAWGQVKAYANMIVVLGFVGVAVAYILSLNQYKKLLVPLLITALLINFSGLFVGLIIDASNILMLDFLGAGDTGNFGVSMVNKLDTIWNNLDFSAKVDSNKDLGKLEGLLAKQVAFIGMANIFFWTYLSLAVTFLVLCVIFAVRYVNLAICFIFAPLAFAMRVMPFGPMQNIWRDWLNRFLKWAFVGVIMTFFLSLSMKVFESAQGIIQTKNFTESNITSQVVSLLAVLIIAFCFMWTGMLLALKAAKPLVEAIMKGLMIAAQLVAAYFTGGATLAGGIGSAVGAGSAASRGMMGLRATRAVGGGKLSQARSFLRGATHGIRHDNVLSRGRRAYTATRAAGGSVPRALGAATGRAGEQIAGGARAGTEFGRSVTARGVDTRRGIVDAVMDNRVTNWIRDNAQGRGTSERVSKERDEKRLDEERKKVNKVEDAGTLTQMAEHGSAYESAAAIEKLAKKNSLELINPALRIQLVDRAVNLGAGSEIIKANAEYATLDADRMALLRANNTQRVGENDGDYTLRIQRMALKEAYARMPEDKELMKLNDQEKIDRIIASAGGVDRTTGRLRGNVDARAAQLIESLAEKGSLGKLAKQLESLGVAVDHGVDAVAGQMNYMSTQLGSTVFKDTAKKDPHYGGLDNESVEERAQTVAGGPGSTVTAAHRTTASNQLRDETYGRISAYQIADSMDESVIDEHFVLNRNTNSQKLDSAGNNERMSETKKNKLKGMLGAIASEEHAARLRGTPADIDWADELRERYRVIRAM